MAKVPYDVTGVSVFDEPGDDRPPEPLPTAESLRQRHRDLIEHPDLPSIMRRRYGLRRKTLLAYEIGFEWRPSGPWVTIPIRDAEGRLVNVRRRYVGSKPELHETGRKYHNLTGRGAPRLYPAHKLPDKGAQLLVCCGEFDALLFRQVTRLAAVTSTGGASNWPDGWDDLAARFDVTVVFDRGEEEYAERVGRRLGARVGHLPDDLPHGTDLADLCRMKGAAGLQRLARRDA